MDDYSPEESSADIIILDVRGKSFVVSLSTLLSHDPSYFSARFRPDSMLDPGLVRVDEQGRNVYEIDRDPTLFQHVLEYVQTNKLPEGIGAWAANKFLWGGVRAEAEYFGLDGLVYLLSITFSCSPDDEDGQKNKGILYWLGTKKGTMGYLNPFERGHVGVKGSWENDDDGDDDKDPHYGPDEKAYFFQYRPNQEGEDLMREVTPESDYKIRNSEGELIGGNEVPVTYEEIWNSDSRDAKSAFHDALGGGKGLFILSGCDACCYGTAGEDPVIISFKNGISISPTHYSIRNAGCFGMAGDWDFAGSIDGGKTWMVLHRQRGKSPLYGGVSGGKGRAESEEDEMKIRAHLRSFKETERKEAVCDYFEQHQRHTFKLDSPSADFFTHFRFTSVLLLRSDVREQHCLHGIGFEIWGDVREELGGQQPSDGLFARIDELESQACELRRQNARLESRVKQLESVLTSQEN